ncbi:hypothetical protein PV11_01100 [Exophiala sideris]|uniref:Uncharacterized protein n=1 Tax=Exophiala sideris TaxID=1016849 RepID=A0A0D1ZF70_9EURO|nr:hypothetical protein PV11_01100 [Exophiala sideris]
MQDIIQAVREAGTGVTKHNAIHILLKEMLVIAIGKLLISNGMLIHRSQTFGRNSTDFTSLNEFKLDTETTDFTFHDASSRYYRAFQRFGQDGIPVLEFREDKRVHISKLLDSLSVIPPLVCVQELGLFAEADLFPGNMPEAPISRAMFAPTTPRSAALHNDIDMAKAS